MISNYKINDTQINIIHLKETDSTNTYAKALALSGEKEGTVVIADRQTNGRGRMGRSFYSPEDTGIYMSVILRPEISYDKVLYITTAAAVSVARAIESATDIKTDIKWVNDVYINQRKVCGILTEGVFVLDKQYPEYVILGIGVNISSPEDGFPEEIKDIAGAVSDKNDINLKERLIKLILDNFFELYYNIGDAPHLDEYRSRNMLCDKEINVIKCDKVISTGVCRGIGDDFSLIIENDEGISHISSGEVSVRINN